MTGIIPIDKPKDITSFGVVAKMRGITGEKKAGHAGTLDPMATGALPILFGGATRFLELLPEQDKGYRAAFRLGVTTDTLDMTGTVLSTCEVTASRDDVEAALSAFRGRILQVPPMYSAVSVGGVRLYELARAGAEVERESREVEIQRLELLGGDESTHEYEINVRCSKGTYIRTLIDDIGKKLGCGAAMTALRRTLACGFPVEKCVTLEEMQRRKDEGTGFDDILVGVEELFRSYDRIVVSPAQSIRFSNGGALDLARLHQAVSDGVYTVYSPDGVFLGLGTCETAVGTLSVRRLLVKRD